MSPDSPSHNSSPHHWYRHEERGESIHSDRMLGVRLLLILLFTVVLFALGHAMVAHHFFAGGALNNHQGRQVGP